VFAKRSVSRHPGVCADVFALRRGEQTAKQTHVCRTVSAVLWGGCGAQAYPTGAMRGLRVIVLVVRAEGVLRSSLKKRAQNAPCRGWV
jgi:hypothetical protein